MSEDIFKVLEKIDKSPELKEKLIKKIVNDEMLRFYQGFYISAHYFNTFSGSIKFDENSILFNFFKRFYDIIREFGEELNAKENNNH
jgi:hypothetical protein